MKFPFSRLVEELNKEWMFREGVYIAVLPLVKRCIFTMGLETYNSPCDRHVLLCASATLVEMSQWCSATCCKIKQWSYDS